MGNPNFDIWKEPRGFLKCLEVFLAIFAFSCATGYRGSFQFLQNCNTTSSKAQGAFQYPFNQPIKFNLLTNMQTNCSNVNLKEVIQPLNERHSTEFFVVIGVFCLLFSVGMLIYYIYFEDVELKHQAKTSAEPVNWASGPVVDFCIAVFFAFFWFVGSIAQAAAVHGIKGSTNVNDIMSSFNCCKSPYVCVDIVVAKYATLTVSILLGFLNTFVWCGNTWFLWKETPWHKEPQNTPVPVPAPHQQIPPAAI